MKRILSNGQAFKSQHQPSAAHGGLCNAGLPTSGRPSGCLLRFGYRAEEVLIVWDSKQALPIDVGAAGVDVGGSGVAPAAAMRSPEICPRVESIGIQADQQERVFASIYQVDQELARQYGGAGLGLFVARQLCEWRERLTT